MKIKWKYCPFSIHDTDYLQFWLEDCSKQGLFLSGSGFVGPFARFYTASPKAMRYRVISALPKTSDDNQMVQMIHDSGLEIYLFGRNSRYLRNNKFNSA